MTSTLFLVTCKSPNRRSNNVVDGDGLEVVLGILRECKPSWEKWGDFLGQRSFNRTWYIGTSFDWIKGTHQIRIRRILLDHELIRNPIAYGNW